MNSPRTQPLGGKVALVTGGSRGIGAAIVERLARDGAAVAFTYVSGQEQADALVAAIAKKGGRALALGANNANVEEVQRAVASTVRSLGRLDILVNNAGILRPGPLTEYSIEDLDQMLAVNIRGTVVATQEAIRHMTSGGRVINIGSVNSDFVPVPGLSVYALTKSAIAGFTRGLTRELGERGITVNNIQPGPVDTEMNPRSGPFSAHLSPLIAVKRYGETSEIASLVAYLAGPESAYITGANLMIDGGLSA